MKMDWNAKNVNEQEQYLENPWLSVFCMVVCGNSRHVLQGKEGGLHHEGNHLETIWTFKGCLAQQREMYPEGYILKKKIGNQQ